MLEVGCCMLADVWFGALMCLSRKSGVPRIIRASRNCTRGRPEVSGAQEQTTFAPTLRNRLTRQSRAAVSYTASRGSAKQNVSTWAPRWKPSTTNVPGSPRIRSRRFESGWFWMLTWPTLTMTSPALTCRRHADQSCQVPLTVRGGLTRAGEGSWRGEGPAARLGSPLAREKTRGRQDPPCRCAMPSRPGRLP